MIRRPFLGPWASVVLLVLLGTCRSQAPKTVSEVARTDVQAPTNPTSAPTRISTMTPTFTLTPSSTPTLPPTPTPTALPISVSGDVRQSRLRTPSPQSGAPCGVVDLLDFPVNPPDAEDTRLFQGFGLGGSGARHHAGEDWGLARAPSFGEPVHSIGHGAVTYAAPLGWGADRGTVILQHVFADSSTILSFYGHLHPPSVVLREGDCVSRGDQVGTIGKPRTPPHLHFEIRSHMPAEPGPGYWSVDPTLAGWEPPSQFIWNNRAATSPGVQWMRPLSPSFIKVLGRVNRDTVAAMQDQALIGINVLDGSLHWQQPISYRPADAIISTARSAIYVIDKSGQLEAFRLPDPQDSLTPATAQPALESMWKIGLDTIGTPMLMPLPVGGVVVSDWHMVFEVSAEGRALTGQRQMFGLAADGSLLWQLDLPTSLDWAPGNDHWAIHDHRLIFTTAGGDVDVWTIDEAGPTAWAAPVGGGPVVADGGLFLYDEEGVYRLYPEMRSAELLYGLPRAYSGLGDMVALADGGLLVAHGDPYDRRLIALNRDGTERWQRSYANVTPGQPRLLLLGDQPYLLLHNDTGSVNSVAIFEIDTERRELTHIFLGGAPPRRSENASAFAIDSDRMLITIPGGSMIALDRRGS